MVRRSLAVVSAGIGQPSSTRLLADRLTAATAAGLHEGGIEALTDAIELRDHARDLTDHLLTGFPSPGLKRSIERVLEADGLIAVTPVFNASYSGLFKLFFDVIERGGLAGMPVLLAATGGTVRHSLVLDHAMRPLFAYLGAVALPTAVYAAAEDWGAAAGETHPRLNDRIQRAGTEFAVAAATHDRRPVADAFSDPVPFETLLGGGGQR